MNKKTVISFLGLIIVVVLWGIAPVTSKYLFDNHFYSPAMLVAFRGALSCLVMIILIIITGEHREFNKSYWICIPAGLILGCAYLFQFIGLDTTTPAKNTFLESFSCIAVPVCLFILTKEKPSVTSVAAALVCVVGSFVLCGHGWDFRAMFTKPTIGDILSASGGIFFGIDIAFTKVFAKGKNSRIYVFIQLLILTIMSFAYAIPFEKGLAFNWDFPIRMNVLFVGVICTAICWVLRTKCIENVSAVACAVLMPMSAVVAAFFSFMTRMEEFSWNVVVGGIIITLAIILSGIADARQGKKEKNIVTQEETVSEQH